MTRTAGTSSSLETAKRKRMGGANSNTTGLPWSQVTRRPACHQLDHAPTGINASTATIPEIGYDTVCYRTRASPKETEPKIIARRSAKKTNEKWMAYDTYSLAQK